MAKYKVLEAFSDLQDNEHIYHPGDMFPRDGFEVSIDRLTSLAGSDNKLGRPLIEYVVETVIDEPVDETEKPAEKAKEEQPKPKRGRRSRAQ